MPAGREMDALVAEKVVGWQSVAFRHYKTGDQYSGASWSEWNGLPSLDSPNFVVVPKYSTDISAAWEVIKKIVGDNNEDRDLFIECWSDGEWFVAFHPVGYSSRKPQASCDGKKTGIPSAPLAICRAALKWKLLEKEEEEKWELYWKMKEDEKRRLPNGS